MKNLYENRLKKPSKHDRRAVWVMGILGLIFAVGGGIYLFGQYGVEKPPQLMLQNGGDGLQGLLQKDVALKGGVRRGFLGFEKSDETAFSTLVIEKRKEKVVPTSLKCPEKAACRVAYVYVEEDTTFETIVKNMNPSAQAVVLAYWNVDQALWQMTDNTFYGTKDEDGNALARIYKYDKKSDGKLGELDQVTVPAGRFFALIHLAPTEVFGVKTGVMVPADEKAGQDGVQFDICNNSNKNGWYSVSYQSLDNLHALLSKTCDGRVKSVWPQTNMDSGEQFTKGYRLDQLPAAIDDNVGKGFHIAWVRLGDSSVKIESKDNGENRKMQAQDGDENEDEDEDEGEGEGENEVRDENDSDNDNTNSDFGKPGFTITHNTLLATDQEMIVIPRGFYGSIATVTLNSKPDGNVVLNVKNGDGPVVEVYARTLTFTEDNYSVPQEIPVDALDPDGVLTQKIQIEIDPERSASIYHGVTVKDITVKNTAAQNTVTDGDNDPGDDTGSTNVDTVVPPTSVKFTSCSVVNNEKYTLVTLEFENKKVVEFSFDGQEYDLVKDNEAWEATLKDGGLFYSVSKDGVMFPIYGGTTTRDSKLVIKFANNVVFEEVLLQISASCKSAQTKSDGKDDAILQEKIESIVNTRRG